MVVSNKEYRMPEDEVYIPIQVGDDIETFRGFMRDNTGDNIADDNPRLCELTAIYWAWKNLKSEYIGFAQYRRHFTDKSKAQRIGKNKFDCIVGGRALEKELNMM